jgi:Arc/MetJ-type ribon-helix-helix transcriptional regulator
MHKTRHELVWQIPVDAELDRRAKSILETGIYISLSELVRDAVRRYLEQRLKREEEHGGA